METVLCLVLLLSCYAGPTLCAHEATGGGESEAASIPVAPPCAMSHERLYKVLKELVIEGLELYINCLSFDRNAALVSGVISGVNQSNSTTGERLDLECVEGIIAGRPTLLPPSMEIMNTTACLNCSDETTNICRGGKSVIFKNKNQTKTPFFPHLVQICYKLTCLSRSVGPHTFKFHTNIKLVLTALYNFQSAVYDY